MKLPDGLTESEFTKTAQQVVDTLAGDFKFGCHEIDDMKQQGILFAVEAMAKGRYDASRPLANFLYRHIRNRLINFKRDNYIRNDPPGEAGETKLADWNRRNEIKKSLIRPLDIDIVGTNHESMEAKNNESVAASNIDWGEFQELINEKLPADLRSDYLRMMEGATVPKSRKDKVRQFVLGLKPQTPKRKRED